jgi:hypothetical protein
MQVDTISTSSLYSRPTSRWWSTCKHRDRTDACGGMKISFALLFCKELFEGSSI